MAFKLAIAPIVEFAVVLAFSDAAQPREAAFTLFGKRSLDEDLETAREDSLRDFLLDRITNWRDQALVLDDAGMPAEFSREAMTCLLQLPGAADAIFKGYLKAISVEGKQKN